MTGRRAATAAGGLLTAALALAACQTADIFQGAATRASAGASGSGYAHLMEIRSAAGLPPLTPNPSLEKAALRQAGYMAGSGKMAHTTGWRRDFETRMKQDGVASPAAENLAHGRMDMARLFRMWMDSTGHRRNMLDPRFGSFGLAYAGEHDGERYWALVLGP